MAYTGIPSTPFTVPGSAAGFLDVRKKGTSSPVVTVAVPAYSSSGGTTKLAYPANLRQTASTTSSATLAWDAVGNATGYRLRRNGGTVLLPGTATSFTDSGLAAGSTPYYEVQSIGGGSFTDSDYSPQVTANVQSAGGTSETVTTNSVTTNNSQATVNATKANSSRAIEYTMNGGQSYQSSNVFSGLPEGTIAAGQFGSRLVGTTITSFYQQPVTIAYTQQLLLLPVTWNTASSSTVTVTTNPDGTTTVQDTTGSTDTWQPIQGNEGIAYKGSPGLQGEIYIDNLVENDIKDLILAGNRQYSTVTNQTENGLYMTSTQYAPLVGGTPSGGGAAFPSGYPVNYPGQPKVGMKMSFYDDHVDYYLFTNDQLGKPVYPNSIAPTYPVKVQAFLRRFGQFTNLRLSAYKTA